MTKGGGRYFNLENKKEQDRPSFFNQLESDETTLLYH